MTTQVTGDPWGLAPRGSPSAGRTGAVVATGTLRVMASIFEAEIGETDGAREVLVTIISPGVSRNGNNYTPEVIRRMVPLLEGAQAYADHPMNPDGTLAPPSALRSVRDLVGYYVRP